MSLPAHLLEAVAAAAVREGLADAVYTRIETPIGPLTVVQGVHGVVRIGFAEEALDRLLAEVAAGLGPRIIASDTELAATRDAIDAYFAGEDETLALPVDFSLVHSPFRRAALEELRTVGAGSVITSGGLAARIGHPRAARAIGTACARNPIPIVMQSVKVEER